MKTSRAIPLKRNSLVSSPQANTRTSLAPFLTLMGLITPNEHLNSPDYTFISLVKQLPQILESTLFNVWEDSNDPALPYFPTVYSHTDTNLLQYPIRRKKVMGLLLIINLLNIVNLLIPEQAPNHVTAPYIQEIST